MATARGYGSPAKAESRYGDGAPAGPKNLLSRDREGRSLAEPVLSGRVPSNGKGQILRFAQDDKAGAKGSG